MQQAVNNPWFYAEITGDYADYFQLFPERDSQRRTVRPASVRQENIVPAPSARGRGYPEARPGGSNRVRDSRSAMTNEFLASPPRYHFRWGISKKAISERND